MITETQVGIQSLAYGSRPVLRTDRSAALTTVDAHARYQEAVLNGNVFGLCLTVVTTATAAGNLMPLTSAVNTTTNFALWNPVSSGVNLVLWQFNLVYSGTTVTPVGGPVWHGMFNAQGISTVTTYDTGRVARNLGGWQNSPKASYISSTSGTSLAGQGVPYLISMANFCETANTYTYAFVIPTTDNIDGKIILTPGTGWVPLLPGAGTNLLVGFSVIWEEIPV